MTFDADRGARYPYLETLAINFVHAIKARLGDEAGNAPVARDLALHLVAAALQDQFGWHREEVTKALAKILGMALLESDEADLKVRLDDIADWIRQGWAEARQMAELAKKESS
jgi:hypothetical protein